MLKKSSFLIAALIATNPGLAAGPSVHNAIRAVTPPRRPKVQPSHTGFRHNLTKEQTLWNIAAEKKQAERHKRRLAARYPDAQ